MTSHHHQKPKQTYQHPHSNRIENHKYRQITGSNYGIKHEIKSNQIKSENHKMRSQWNQKSNKTSHTDLLKTTDKASKLTGSSKKNFNSEARFAEANLTTGALVIPSFNNMLEAPPEMWMALQPRLVLATRQPSVVAMGTEYSNPSSNKGPAIPTGIWT